MLELLKYLSWSQTNTKNGTKCNLYDNRNSKHFYRRILSNGVTFLKSTLLYKAPIVQVQTSISV